MTYTQQSARPITASDLVLVLKFYNKYSVRKFKSSYSERLRK